MKKLLILIYFFMGFMQAAYAQGKSFEADLSALRNDIIGMCAQLQAGTPKESREQLLAEIDAIIAGWEAMTAAYKDTPPAEYAKDPAWKSYFEEATDNFRIMKQKTEDGNYKRATQFCGHNCGLFVKIHNVNGISTLTDKMFVLRQNVRLAASMAKAGNWNGAKEIMKRASMQMGLIKKAPPPVIAEKTAYKNDINRVEKLLGEINAVIKAREAKKIDAQLKQFLGGFRDIYIKYI